MHPVENLTILYRARRYNTGNRGLSLPYQHIYFGDTAFSLLNFIGKSVSNTWLTLYEPCPVVKTTAMEIIVVSQDLSPEILEIFPDFYKGGKFHINKAKLQRDGKALHTRYGEYFYIDVPDSAIALPESKELLEVAL
jgi:hypothetical protein